MVACGSKFVIRVPDAPVDQWETFTCIQEHNPIARVVHNDGHGTAWTELPEEDLRELLRRILAENGFAGDGVNPHSWRCADKDRYPGDCTCAAETVDDILVALGVQHA